VTISANGLAAVAGLNTIRVFTPTTVVNSTEQNLESLLSIYPNPSSDFVYLKADNALFGKIYSFFDLNGKLLKRATLNENSAIDMSEFASGIYCIKIEGNNQTFKIVKH